MNIAELKEKLKAERVSPALYNLDMKGRDDERLNIVFEDGKWVVYYLERGMRTTEEKYDTEDEACRCILRKFRLL